MYCYINKENIDNFQIDDVITKKEDAFSKELIIQTKIFVIESELLEVNNRYTYFRNQKYHKLPEGKEVVFDILFKSTPNGEDFFIYPKGTALVIDELNILINGNATITLRKYGCADDCFSISKQDFIKCCEAKTFSFQFRRKNNSVYEDTSSREDIILYFQALYYEAIDDTKYQDAKEALMIKCQKGLDAYKQWAEQHKKKEKEKKASLTTVCVILIVLGVILLVLALNSKLDAAGSACLVSGLIFALVGTSILVFNQ